MKGMVVTTTGFEKDVKAELQMLVERMAAIYSNNFHEGVTHLVANAVGSKKYIVSIVQRILGCGVGGGPGFVLFFVCKSMLMGFVL